MSVIKHCCQNSSPLSLSKCAYKYRQGLFIHLAFPQFFATKRSNPEPNIKVINTMPMSWWKKYGIASETLSFSPRFYQATWTSGPRWLRAHVLAIQKGEDLNLIHIRYLALKSIDCNLNPWNAYLLGIYLQPHSLPQTIKKTMGFWTCGNF